MEKLVKININGGGAWGRSLAFALAQKQEVSITSRRDLSTFITSINTPYKIEQVPLEIGIKAPLQVVAISSSAVRIFLENLDLDDLRDKKFLFASKGIEDISGKFISDIVEDFISTKKACFLAGPSFAKEVLEKKPCALCIHSRNLELAREFSAIFPSFIKSYESPDIIGGEIAGAYKNVIAIASGICAGLNLGENAKASLLARGLVEMDRFGEHFGASRMTFLGLSGAGDLFLTSNSTLSRNYRVGLNLAKGIKIQKIKEDLGEVAEGIKTAAALNLIAKKENLYLPIATAVYKIIKDELNAKEALAILMSKDEEK